MGSTSKTPFRVVDVLRDPRERDHRHDPVVRVAVTDEGVAGQPVGFAGLDAAEVVSVARHELEPESQCSLRFRARTAVSLALPGREGPTTDPPGSLRRYAMSAL